MIGTETGPDLPDITGDARDFFRKGLKPDYELTWCITGIHGQLGYTGKFVQRAPGQDDSPLNPLGAMTTAPFGGVTFFCSHMMLDGQYAAISGVLGETWRLMVAGYETDVRHRRLDGAAGDFHLWAADMVRQGLMPRSGLLHGRPAPSPIRLRAVLTEADIDALTARLREAAIGAWEVHDNPAMKSPGFITHVELVREEDATLLEEELGAAICGSNWFYEGREPLASGGPAG
jgi:hypothetical protein